MSAPQSSVAAAAVGVIPTLVVILGVRVVRVSTARTYWGVRLLRGVLWCLWCGVSAAKAGSDRRDNRGAKEEPAPQVRQGPSSSWVDAVVAVPPSGRLGIQLAESQLAFSASHPSPALVVAVDHDVTFLSGALLARC